ncbi:RICIN domain-containing protein [Paenibacillus monticola]|uniref:Ricin B lectin domain-containing protein n=1 Tax=Paenibacillus monticola TaxID=2666075 RepID=A0A7X2L328_9BACL|nr:RICIN domain-containing protein [Paenibacillus monticola]MRN55029.1 hypothetical protein [Paenibacillus monticola]
MLNVKHKRIKNALLSLLTSVLFIMSVSLGTIFYPKHVSADSFTHSGILYSQADFDRAKQQVTAGVSPWIDAWNAGKLTSYASSSYTPSPVAAPARWGGHPDLNSGNTQMFNDAEAALVQAIIWKVSSNSTEANNARLKAEQILDAWSSTVNTAVGGDEKQLLAGLNGYKFAAAADIMKSDTAWNNAGKFTAIKNMLLNYFLPSLRDYLTTHYNSDGDYGSYPYYYRGNQDIAPMVTIMAIGVLCDDLTIYIEAVNHFKNGNHNGRVTYYLFPTTDSNLAQSEESGRDQPHAQLGLGLLATMAQISYVQKSGDSTFEDLYEYSNRLILKGTEYAAKYNSGGTVPFTPIYTVDWRNEPVVSASGRGKLRPIYDMVWNHYHYVKGLADSASTDPVYNTRSLIASFEPESVSTDHQPFTTLLYTRTPIISGEIYSLMNPVSGKMLDVASGGTANGTNVQLWQDAAGNNQRFTIIDNGDGTYRLIGLQSGKALDVNGAGTAEGTNVQIWTYSGSANQKWKITANSDSSFKLIDSNSGKVLDVSGNSTANGTNVQILTDNGGAAQKWKLIRGGIISGGTYKLLNPNSGKVLDLSNGSTADGTAVQIAEDATGSNQQWTITRNEDGTYKIIGVSSGKALEVFGGSTDDGTKVSIWPYSGGANQKWKIIMNTDGTYKLIDSNSNRILNVIGNGTSAGTSVEILLNNGLSGQKWKLVKQ